MTPDEIQLSGKVALVVGENEWAAQAALALAEAGCKIAVAASDQRFLRHITRRLDVIGSKPLSLHTNFTDTRAVQKAADDVITEFSKIDVLINCPWIEFAKPFTQVNDAEYSELMNKNVMSNFLFTRKVGEHMLERKKGAIINILSALAIRALPNSAVFCMSMAAIHHLTKALALEWAREGVRVNAIGLGWFSPGSPSMTEEPDGRIARLIPMKRYGRPEELGPAVIYLASDSCPYTTGQTFFLDGGLLSRA